MPRSPSPFTTTKRGNYLDAHVDNIATVVIKREDEGVIIDVYPFKDMNAEPVTSTWVHDHDLATEEQPPAAPLTPWQRTALMFYNFGEFAYLADAKDARSLPEDLRDCGDSLLRFVFSELSKREDCTSYDDAVRRMTMARNQLDDLIADLQELAATPAASGNSPRFRIAWFIDSDAATPEDAAHEAHRIQRGHQSTATVFQVRETATGRITTIDLAEDQPQ